MTPTNQTPDGGPAFPVPMIPCDYYGGYTEVRATGLSLRDYFAAKALVTLVKSYADSDPKHARVTANAAYEFADAMLRAREGATP